MCPEISSKNFYFGGSNGTIDNFKIICFGNLKYEVIVRYHHEL